jgi:large subunit ribosomal protein L18
MIKNKKIIKRIARRKRIRGKILGTFDRPRLSVFRSNKHIFAQVIDDERGKTLVFASDMEVKSEKKSAVKKSTLSNEKINTANSVGEVIAKKALKKKVKNVVFDRSGYRYHGRVKALAEGARKGGLQF